MLRKSIIMMALATAFTINVSAVQIEVPKWQPPVPGADASIPANAYENYSHSNEKAIQEAEKFSVKVQKSVEKPKIAIEKVFKEKTGLAQAVKLGEFSESTVILLHEGNNEGVYTYPSLENASWKILKAKTHVMYTEFTPSKTKTTYGITYLGGGDVNDPYQDKFAEVVMSNYIIPSIETLSRLDNYSHVKHWDNFSYRIPKKVKLVSEAMEDNKYEVRTYEASGIKIRVLRFQIDPNVVDKSLAKKQIFAFLNKYGDLEAPTQYATVWNNGIPGFLVDRYKSNGESYLRHFTKDSEYYYSYRIDYDESKSSYKHKQLRDMVEYVDFDNVESLRKAPQWRISNSHKKKLDADPIFNPWYMEWIKILTQ